MRFIVDTCPECNEELKFVSGNTPENMNNYVQLYECNSCKVYFLKSLSKHTIQNVNSKKKYKTQYKII